MKNTILPIVFLALAGAPASLLPSAIAQQRVAAQSTQAAPTPADQLATADLVRNAATMIADNYVFPDVGRQTAAMLSANLAAGDYDGLDAQQLAQAISRDLREYTEDLHFGARWQPPREPEAGEQPRRARPQPSGTYGFEKIERLEGNIGYIDLRGFNQASAAAPAIHAAMRLMQGSNAIIFDLRRNGGGDPETVQLLSSYLFDPSEPVHLNSLYFRPADETTEFWTTPDIQSDAMPDTPVYVLTSGYTFSAAEEFTYNLKSLDRATVVGETTGGGAHPVNGFEVGDGIMLRIPVGRAINPITGTNWEGAGVTPHIETPAADALTTAHTLALEAIVENDPSSPAAWALQMLKIQLDPVTLGDKDLAEIAGTYGDRLIENRDGTLYYKRNGVGTDWRPLTPLATDTFVVDGVDGFRMVLERDAQGDGQAITGIRGVYRDGPSDFSPRD
ncbi:MAG: hypothetical protein ACI89L_002321 [Phycisphaerales bacterium]|jgi:hypothetical protein